MHLHWSLVRSVAVSFRMHWGEVASLHPFAASDLVVDQKLMIPIDGLVLIYYSLRRVTSSNAWART